MSSKVDMSLDDIIVKNKISTRGTRRGRGRGAMRGAMRGSGRGGRSRGRGAGISQRGRGFTRSSSGFRSPRGSSNINGRWSHDMYYGGASAVRALSSGPTKLNITNLEFGVSDSDIKELFSEFGNMRTASVHYDRTGRSLGTAHVIFERRPDALKAIKQYNGVHLDGRPMNIEIDGGSAGGGGMGRGRGGGLGLGRSSLNGLGGSRVKRLQGGPRPIGGGGGGGGRGRGPRGRGIMRGTRGRGGGRMMRGGGRGGKKKVPTAEELDAELDAYSFEANTK